MDVTLYNSDVIRELTLLEKITAKKSSNTILTHVLISANGEGSSVRLQTTDAEIGLTGRCTADIHESGAITLPAKRLLDLAREQSDKMLRLTQHDAQVKFSSGRFTSRLQSLPASDFPSLASPSETDTPILLPREPLLDAFNQVKFAMSDRPERYFLNGALLKLTEGQVTVAASDSLRMAISVVARRGEEIDQVLLPRKAVDELLALLSEKGTDAPIKFQKTDNHLFFTCDDRVLLSRQIDGNFPDYTKLLPSAEEMQAATMITVDRFELLKVLKRQSLVSDTVLLSITKNRLQTMCSDAKIGEGVEDLPVVYDGPDMNLHMKTGYLIDFLTAAFGQNISIFNDDKKNMLMLRDGNYVNLVSKLRQD